MPIAVIVPITVDTAVAMTAMVTVTPECFHDGAVAEHLAHTTSVEKPVKLERLRTVEEKKTT
jgi:2-methylaconitate cis-trans-isomerase PrpF